jgi:hypothetical protein
MSLFWAISRPKMFAWNEMVETTAVELGGYALIIDTELALETNKRVPSVFTLSSSSTPWTCTFVPVNERDETSEAMVEDPATVMLEAAPN